ncbi:hypothetical protein GCM10010448_02640 [Streptomyces glomeratus]|uniref:Uncharacterized protein n=1 Tax=Streptomyces glomeratus TaxID=284452 RepID=A0ABP6KUP0_9ACTN
MIPGRGARRPRAKDSRRLGAHRTGTLAEPSRRRTPAASTMTGLRRAAPARTSARRDGRPRPSSRPTDTRGMAPFPATDARRIGPARRTPVRRSLAVAPGSGVSGR